MIPRQPLSDACPKATTHTDSPSDYVAHAEWAEVKAMTHTQHRCPTCGFWAIWKPRVHSSRE